MEILKRALRELVEKEPTFFRDILLEALRGDGRAAEILAELLTKHPEARVKLAETIAATITIPLNVATKQDIEELKQWTEAKLKDIENRMATKEDLKRLEDKMATKEQFEALAVGVEESGRDWVQYFLEQRGFRCTADRLQIDGFYEFDIYCNAGVLTAVGEAKVRAGGRWLIENRREDTTLEEVLTDNPYTARL